MADCRLFKFSCFSFESCNSPHPVQVQRIRHTTSQHPSSHRHLATKIRRSCPGLSFHFHCPSQKHLLSITHWGALALDFSECFCIPLYVLDLSQPSCRRGPVPVQTVNSFPSRSNPEESQPTSCAVSGSTASQLAELRRAMLLPRQCPTVCAGSTVNSPCASTSDSVH